MSACVNARSVCVRTFPRAPLLNPSAVMDVSSGASTTATTSYAPSVQNTSFTVAPHFFAMSYLAAAFTGDSFAADWPVTAISPAYRLVPIERTGLYFGVNAGYGWAKESSTIFFTGLMGGRNNSGRSGRVKIAARGDCRDVFVAGQPKTMKVMQGIAQRVQPCGRSSICLAEKA